MNEFANKSTENFKTMKENIKTLTLGDILNIHNIIISLLYRIFIKRRKRENKQWV